MSKNNYLYRLINDYISTGDELSFHELESNKISIKHKTPEPKEVNLTSKLRFTTNIKSKSHITMNLGGKDTEMIYVSDNDMFVGYRNINSKSYQMSLYGITLGEKFLLEISYNDLDEPMGHGVGHNGTIHPTE